MEYRRKTQSGAEHNYEEIVPRTAFEGNYNAESLAGVPHYKLL
ncbi:hypothetical protein [Treponema sp.]